MTTATQDRAGGTGGRGVGGGAVGRVGQVGWQVGQDATRYRDRKRSTCPRAAPAPTDPTRMIQCASASRPDPLARGSQAGGGVGVRGAQVHHRTDDRAAAGGTAAALREAEGVPHRALRRSRSVAHRRLGHRGSESLRRSRLLRRVSLHGTAARVRPGGAEVRQGRRARAGARCRGERRSSTASCSGRSRA